jgi:uncharacterized protein YcbK (DUF882 family)
MMNRLSVVRKREAAPATGSTSLKIFNSTFGAATRVLTTFCMVVLFLVATPQAWAVKSTLHKKSKTHAAKQTDLNLPMPVEGYLLDEDDPLLEEIPYLFADQQHYSLKLARAWSGESMEIVYRIGDFYIPDALNDINYFWRDNHDETVSETDPRLLDVLHTLLARVGRPDGEIIILSGFRTQETNDELRASHRTNAAEYSQHLYGRAIDIRIPGLTAAHLRNVALAMKVGGVGYYPRGQFLHVDVGPVRHWTFSGHHGRRKVHGKKKPATKK